MFCTNCGKEIIDTAKFCNFCGMPVKNMAASVPITPVQSAQPTQSVQPAQPIQPVPQPVQTAPDYAENAGITEAPETASEIPTVENIGAYDSESAGETAEEADIADDDNAVPTPNTIPTYGASEPIFSAPPVYPDPPVTPVPITQEIKTEVMPENKPERKYTLGHIMMCLAAVAVMAIVAGVFAGLYFSVV